MKTVKVHIFDKKDRAQAFADKKNKHARKYHWTVTPYQTGYKVRPVSK